MNLKSYILTALAGPTTAYAVMLAGGALVIAELLRPGRGWAGIPGAVLVTIAVYALAQRPVTWSGVSLLTLSICIMLISLRGTSNIPPLLSGGAFLTGSVMLFDGAERIHMGAATIGGMFAFGCHWLLRIAYRARAGKRANG